MRRAHQIAGLVFLLIALFLGYHAGILRYYTSLGPGPGFFPIWLCLGLGLLALGVAARATLAPAEELPDDFFAPRSGYARIGVILAALFALLLAMPVLGFSLSMFAFYLALLSQLGRRRFIETLALAALGSFGARYLFSELLSQPLPAGYFGI